ncbi:MAG: hypothetical protein VXW91_01245 [Pseudomonadota bacterium]|nr:hypothetical protein [Pseudomonadota bacterium]
MSDHQETEERKISNQFVRACAEGRHDDVLLMIAEGADVDQFDKGFKEGDWQCTDGNEPNSFMQNGLQMAIRNKDMTLLRILDQAGADFAFKEDKWIPDPENEGKNKKAKVTADLLGDMAHAGFYEGFLYLLSHKGFTLPTDSDARGNLLLSAISGGSMDECEESGSRFSLVEYLIDEQGFDVHYIDDRNRRPLSEAVGRETDSAILKLVLNKGVDPNYDNRVVAKYKISFSDMFKDSVDDQMPGGFSLFERMGNVMKKYRNTPLSEAVFNAVMYCGREDEQQDSETEQYLAELSPTEREREQQRMAKYRVRQKEIAGYSLEKVKMLLEHGADPYFKDNDGVCAMDYFYDDDAIEMGLVRGEAAKVVEGILQDWIDGKRDKPAQPKPYLN